MLWLAFVLSLYANLMFKPHVFWNLILYNEITERLSNDPAVVIFIYVQSTCFSEQGIRNYREVWTTDFQDGFPCMFPLYWWRQLKVSSRSFFGKRVLFTKKKKEITLCSAFLQSLVLFDYYQFIVGFVRMIQILQDDCDSERLAWRGFRINRLY